MKRDDYRTRHPSTTDMPAGSLFKPPTTYPTGTLTDRFLTFHDAHPEVYEALLSLALEAKQAGRDKASIKMMYEVVRWQRYIGGQPNEGDFRLNNDFHSRFARLLMLEHPELDGLFELRELHTA
jgi:hypothetical protein